MRFAGTRMESFMGGENRPDFGNIGESALAMSNKESTTATDLMGKTASVGIKAAGDVEAAGIVGQAQAGVAQAQGQAAIMEGIGGIASSALGAIPTGGGGGAGTSMKWNPSGVDTTSAYSSGLNIGGQDYSSFISNPSFTW